MEKFSTNWQNFRSETPLKENKKEILKEFSNKEKNNILQNGDNFTISYEIEMESDEEIDEYGNYENIDISHMSPEEQIEYFDYSSYLRERAGNRELENFEDDFLSTSGSDFTSGVPEAFFFILACYIQSLGEFSFPINIRDSDIETFVLASYLNSDRGVGYYEYFEKIAENKVEYREFLNKIDKLGADVSSAYYLLDAERIQFIYKVFGLSFNDGDIGIQFITNKNLSPREMFEIAIFPRNDEFFKEELRIMSGACEYLYNGIRYIDINNVLRARAKEAQKESTWNTITREYERRPNRYSKIEGFDEFKIGMQYFAEEMESKKDSLYEKLVKDFDYRNYSLEPKGYGSGNMKNALEDHLPNFWRIYGRDMKTMSDGSISQGIEIAMDTYLEGVQAAMEHLDIFFDDFNKQNFFTFADSTGLHTNISMDLPNKQFNLIKLLFALSEKEGKGGEAPFAYKGTESRYGEQWSAPIKDILLNSVKKNFKENPGQMALLKDFYSKNNFNSISTMLNRAIYDAAVNQYVKSHGLNLHYINDRGYIEFRYPGHYLKKDALKNLTLYYCYIVKNALDPSFNDQTYKKKLVGFVQEIFGFKKEGIEPKEYKKFINLYKDFRTNEFYTNPSIYMDKSILSLNSTPFWLPERKIKFISDLKPTMEKIAQALQTTPEKKAEKIISAAPRPFQKILNKIYNEQNGLDKIYAFLLFILVKNSNNYPTSDWLIYINSNIKYIINNFILEYYKKEEKNKSEEI